MTPVRRHVSRDMARAHPWLYAYGDGAPPLRCVCQLGNDLLEHLVRLGADHQVAVDGEAAFAASDSNIAIVGDHVWVATGGIASRILYSSDKGAHWEVFNTPIVQGLATNGMYSLDFYDQDNGFAIGGDYTKPADSSANKIRTKDGGRTWELVAKNQSPG